MNTISQEPISTRLATWPNLFSALRLASVPLGLWLARRGDAKGFLICFAFQLLSDNLDGFLARRLKQNSVLGAQLDSVADLAMWMGLALGAWWLWPDIVRREIGWLVLGIAAYLVPLAVGFWKYGRLTSYHTWSAKASSVVMAVGSLLLLLNSTPWLFRAGILISTLSAIEDLALTAMLQNWQANVPSIWHARRLRAFSDWKEGSPRASIALKSPKL